jgi:AraC-like DNA-binding protein
MSDRRVLAPRGWRGSIVLDAGRALYRGPAGDTKPHRHHALQLCIALDESLGVELAGTEPRSFRGLLIGANVEHRVDGRGETVALYYVEASSEEGQALTSYLAGALARPLPPAARAVLRRVAPRDLPGEADLLDEWRRSVAKALGIVQPGTRGEDREVLRAVQALEKAFPGNIPAGQLARLVGLRQRALAVRFRRETGMSVRAFVLWLRLKAAVRHLAGGRNLTDAAYAAGFSDGAHLSRTFVRMFGLAPSAGLSRAEVRAVRTQRP